MLKKTPFLRSARKKTSKTCLPQLKISMIFEFSSQWFSFLWLLKININRGARCQNKRFEMTEMFEVPKMLVFFSKLIRRTDQQIVGPQEKLSKSKNTIALLSICKIQA